jgi:hypothetical protein
MSADKGYASFDASDYASLIIVRDVAAGTPIDAGKETYQNCKAKGVGSL